MLSQAMTTENSSHLDILCSRLTEGHSMRSVARDLHVALKTLYAQIESSDEARKQYVRAREIQAENFADEMVEMSDEAIGKPHEVVQAVKNAVDARKWVAAKLLPKKYGDQPMTNTVQVNVAVISVEEQAELQERRRKLLEE